MADKTSPTVPVRVKGQFTSMKRMHRLSNLGNQTKNTTEAPSIKGRRVIDIEYFGRQFDQGCSACGKELHFRDIIGEQYYELCSRFIFKYLCGELNPLVTSRTLKKKTIFKKRGAYAVSIKTALGTNSIRIPILNFGRIFQIFFYPMCG